MPGPPASAPTAPKSTAERLPFLLNFILIPTANAFTESRRQGAQPTIHYIPATIDRFQCDLDCLEVEILRAKATFRRDLEVLREKAAEEAKMQLTTEEEGSGKVDVEEKPLLPAQEKRNVEQSELQAKGLIEQTDQSSNTNPDRHNLTTSDNIAQNENVNHTLNGSNFRSMEGKPSQSSQPSGGVTRLGGQNLSTMDQMNVDQPNYGGFGDDLSSLYTYS